MVVERVKELEFYRSLVGEDFRGEYGERLSAHRRGTAFERAAFDNDAAQLKDGRLAPRFGLPAEDIWARNFAEEIPGRRRRCAPARLHRLRGLPRPRRRRARPRAARPAAAADPDPARGQVLRVHRARTSWCSTLSGDIPAGRAEVVRRSAMASPREPTSISRAPGRRPGDRAHGARRAGRHRRPRRGARRVHLRDALRAQARPAASRGDQRRVPRDPAGDRAARRRPPAARRAPRGRGHRRSSTCIDEFPADYQEACHGTCILAGPCKEAAAGRPANSATRPARWSAPTCRSSA